MVFFLRYLMQIVYTKHAIEMVNFRNIKKQQIEQCIMSPDRTFIVREDRKAYLKKFGKNYLKLIAYETRSQIIIITCYFIAKNVLKSKITL